MQDLHPLKVWSVRFGQLTGEHREENAESNQDCTLHTAGDTEILHARPRSFPNSLFGLAMAGHAGNMRW